MKFFRRIFAVNGDKDPIPVDAPGTGEVSFEDGYTLPYELAQDDPNKLNIERRKLNQLLADITENIQLWQVQAYPEFIEAADNEGANYPYGINAFVTGNGHAGQGIYVSLEDNNTALLSDDTKWQLFNPQLLGAPLGSVLDYDLNTLPSGFLWANGRTIGNGLSGATARANDDTFDLYSGIWSSYTNTTRPIQNDDGTPGARGASAQADFDAGKRLPLPDRRHRTSVGNGLMGGATSPGLLTGYRQGVNGDVLGATGGEEKHVPIVDEMATHTHVHQQDDRTGPGSGFNVGSLATASDRTSSRVNRETGDGEAFNVVQPTIVCNFIIRY